MPINLKKIEIENIAVLSDPAHQPKLEKDKNKFGAFLAFKKGKKSKDLQVDAEKLIKGLNDNYLFEDGISAFIEPITADQLQGFDGIENKVKDIEYDNLFVTKMMKGDQEIGVNFVMGMKENQDSEIQSIRFSKGWKQDESQKWDKCHNVLSLKKGIKEFLSLGDNINTDIISNIEDWYKKRAKIQRKLSIDSDEQTLVTFAQYWKEAETDSEGNYYSWSFHSFRVNPYLNTDISFFDVELISNEKDLMGVVIECVVTEKYEIKIIRILFDASKYSYAEAKQWLSDHQQNLQKGDVTDLNEEQLKKILDTSLDEKFKPILEEQKLLKEKQAELEAKLIEKSAKDNEPPKDNTEEIKKAISDNLEPITKELKTVKDEITLLKGREVPPTAQDFVFGAKDSKTEKAIKFGDGYLVKKNRYNFTDSDSPASELWNQIGNADLCPELPQDNAMNDAKLIETITTSVVKALKEVHS